MKKQNTKFNPWDKSSYTAKNKSNPWAGSRKREVVGSNGTLQSVFLKECGIGETTELRKAIASTARASVKEQEVGRSTMLTRPFQASNRAYNGQDNAFMPTDKVMSMLSDAHIALNTFEKGSVGKLLLDLHSLGFRIFSKAGLAGSFRAADIIKADEDAFRKSLDDAGFSLPSLTIPNLYNSITSSIRGKGENTDIGVLAARFFMSFVAVRTPNEKDVKTKSYALCVELAKVLCSSYKTYTELSKEAKNSFHILTPVFSKLGVASPVPALQKLSKILDTDGDLKYCTITFDADAPQFPLDIKPETSLMAIAARYAQEAQDNGVNVTNYVQEAMTTSNANGIGWFINKGFSLLPVATDDELMAATGANRNNKEFKGLINSINAVHTPKLFDGFSFSDIRSDLKGKIDSFVANHLSRISLCRDSLISLTPQLTDWIAEVEKHSHLIASTGAYNQPMLEELAVLVAEGTEASFVLSGSSKQTLSYKLIEKSIKNYQEAKRSLDYAAGLTNQINAVLKRSDATDFVHLPVEVNNLMELPTFGEPILSPKQDREKSSERLGIFTSELSDLIGTLSTSYNLSYDKALESRKAFFEPLIKGKHRTIKSTAEFAYRDLVSRLTKLAYSGTEEFRTLVVDALWSAGIFSDKEELVEHITKRQHYVVVHPMDNKPKKLLRTSGNQPRLDLLFESLLDDPRLSVKDRTHLQLLHYSILLMGLPENVDTSLLPVDTLQEFGDYRFVSLLRSPKIPRVAAQSLINTAYRSRISGLLYRLNKRQFVHTQSFAPYLTSRLVYVPKATEWLVPVQQFEGRYAALLGSDLMVWIDDRKMDVLETAKKISGDKEFPVIDKLSLLKDMPHSYAINAGIVGMGMTETAITIEPKGIKRASKRSGLIPISLPRNNRPAVKAIENWMTGSKISPPLIQFQSAYNLVNEEVVEDKEKRKILFKIPVTESSQVQPKGLDSDIKIIGIDPSEYGLGLSLTDFNGTVIDSGFMHVNSLINHIKRKKEHKTITTPRQEYKAHYSNHLQQSAKAAVGDIAHILDRLLSEFNCIMVFENQGEQSFNGSDVWDKIISLYSFSENKAQDAERVSHWFGAKFWDYTGISRKLPSENKPKPFIGFPATRVGAAGNSQRCSSCGRNPIDAARSMMAGGQTSIVGGTLRVKNGELSLFNPNPANAAQRRREGLAPEWVQVGDKSFPAVSPGSKEGREIITIIRRSIRRAPSHRKTTQGIESVYHCAYSDCGHTTNAEANAAINTAQKLSGQLSVDL